ncbi:hypothetical protein [Mailhella sp.]
MAKKKVYLGKAEGCQLLPELLARQDEKRAFYEQGIARHPHLVPCALNRGWWIYRTSCDFCAHAVRKP